MTRNHLLTVLLCLLLAAPSLAGCAPAGGSAQPTPAMVDSLRRTAEEMAPQWGLTVEEAYRRLVAEDPIGTLQAELEAREADTFAGLWIENEPEVRVVVAFTRDGEKTLEPYLKLRSIPGLEVRRAGRSLAELSAIQGQVIDLVRELGFPFSTSTDVQANQVELWVSDRAAFEAALKDAGRELPDGVKVVVTYEPLGEHVPFAVTPAAGVAFPQLRAQSTAFMMALLEGTLVVRDGCLRVSPDGREPGELILWQPDLFLNDDRGTIEVLDREGQVVARVGEAVRMDGGEVPLTAELERQLRQPVPESCPGPYWLMGHVLAGP